MKRRDFVVALGGTVALPLIPQVQGAEPVRRVGVLLPATINDPEWKARSDAFLEALAQLGWVVDRNVQIETRWGTPDTAELRRHAAELAALAPDVILAGGTSTVGPLLQAASAVPIIFAVVNDPAGAGFVESLARPGGNATGLMTFEYSLAGKWLDLLKQIAPGVTRVAVLRDASQGSATSMFAAIQALASSLRVDVVPINMRDAGEVGSSRVDLQACKLEYSIVSPK